MGTILQLLVRPFGHVLNPQPDQTLLQALRAGEVPISYSCEDGRCGLCRCRLLRGRLVEAGRPPRELFGCAGRYVLACQSTVAEDSVIEIPDPREMIIHRGRRMRAKVLDILPLSHNVRQLRLKPDSQFSYSPGQFVEVELGRGINRMYSMAGLAADEELQFHVRLHPYGRASHVIGEDLKPDDTVRVRGPYGVSYLRQFHDAPILCVSAGTGLAPLKSLLRGLIDFRMMNPVHVYVGFMSREEVYDLEALSGLLARVPGLRSSHVMVASGRIDRGLRRGLLTEAIESDLGKLCDWHAHVFGSPFAVDATVQLLRRKEIHEDRLHADPFHSVGS